MSTLTKTKKPVTKKSASVKRAAKPRAFARLVRDPNSGLLVSPLKPGQKPISRSALQKALADAL